MISEQVHEIEGALLAFMSWFGRQPVRSLTAEQARDLQALFLDGMRALGYDTAGAASPEEASSRAQTYTDPADSQV